MCAYLDGIANVGGVGDMDMSQTSKVVRIVTPQGGVPTAMGTKIFLPDGTEVPCVTKITINPLEASQSITAVIEVAVSLADIHAHPLLGLESLREAAAAHGFTLTPVGGGE